MYAQLLKKASDHGNSELNRVDFLDGWRGLAISLVLLSHFFLPSGFDLGRMGVDVFFVLSGMLMSKILFIKRTDLKTFYQRRLSRIFPVFILFVTVIYFIDYVLGLSREHENYVYSLLFLRTYLPESSGIWEAGAPIGHLWSLNVEEHSYVILSLLTLMSFLKGREYILLIGLGSTAIAIHYLYIRYPDLVYGNWELRTEVAMSHLFISAGYFLIRDKCVAYVHCSFPVIALLLALLCYHSDAHWALSWVASPFLLAFAVNHLDETPTFFKRVLEFSILRLLGIWSFSIYLWQHPFYHYGKPLIQESVFYGILLLFLSFLVALISFYYVENPVRRFLNNRWT